LTKAQRQKRAISRGQFWGGSSGGLHSASFASSGLTSRFAREDSYQSQAAGYAAAGVNQA
jgi:hypothetical protein